MGCPYPILDRIAGSSHHVRLMRVGLAHGVSSHLELLISQLVILSDKLLKYYLSVTPVLYEI